MIHLAPRHGRFLAAFGVGVLVALAALLQGQSAVYVVLLGGNAFFILYLALMARLIRASGPAELRAHAEQDDEGVALILLLALLAIIVSLAAIFLVLSADESMLSARLFALVSIPLGWTTVHVLVAMHYAHLYYHGAHGGMTFPGKGEPDAMDFVYASFVIGMTAQVSDVTVESRQVRKAVLVHSVVSFFYNTCILALAINAAITAGQ
ncbi:DUF1345 domain-containing protein [Tabrizicola piscis]|uniref:DUF1345 domain-containing protein n=1 Tax=Tabrizicola piscis TaxID=2494374 RepID=A0A3S8U549_9RHOB|nr:DUF1345 domain-containing protein [Tabrizicola piscis]AZL58675.1 DUF1345 domain-containing protein [Tabrizicola piscis]